MVPYGPGALAGVVDMTSLSQPGVDATVEGASRNGFRGHIYAGLPVRASVLTVDAQGARSDGFVPVTYGTRGPADRPAPYEEASLRARWVTPLTQTVEAQIGGLAFIDDRDRGVEFTGNRTRGADASLRLVGRGRWQWSALAYTQWRNLRSSFASVSDGRLSASRVSLQDSVPSRGLGFSGEVRPPIHHNVNVRLGMDMRSSTGESRELYSFIAGEPTRRRIAGGETATQGVFVDATLKHGAVMLSGGARLDRWTIRDGKLFERLLAGGPPTRDDAYPKRSGWHPTLRAGAVIDFAKGASLRVAAYSGWRLPTLNELFRPFRAGADATAANPELKPESLSGVESGFDFRRDAFTISVTAIRESPARRDRQRNLGTRARHLSRCRLRRRRLSAASEHPRGQRARHRSERRNTPGSVVASPWRELDRCEDRCPAPRHHLSTACAPHRRPGSPCQGRLVGKAVIGRFHCSSITSARNSTMTRTFGSSAQRPR